MSSDNIAIRVRNLGKKYTLGGPQEQYLTLRDAIVNSVKVPFKRFHCAPPTESFWALKDVSFNVEQGEVVGIIGRNGAGKSTLLKILSRITTPTEGFVEINGRVGSLLEVGTGFHPEMTGRENIFLNGSILGMKKTEIEQKFDEIVKFSEIEKFIDTPVKRYSSGMYVRLAFAVAAHLEPEILVVDEVLAVGDIAFQKKCLGKMEDVAKEGRTVIFVSHNMEAVQRLCSHAILLDEGTVIMKGSTAEVISKYLGEDKLAFGEQIWPDFKKAPGDGVVRMKAMRVLDRSGKVCTSFDVRDPVSIEVEYLVLEEGHRLVLQLYFFNELGHVLFISKDNLDSPWKDTKCPTGHYRSICHIPGDFLNEGVVSVTYGIDTIAILHTMHATGRDVVGFKVSDRMDPEGVRGNFPLQWREDGVRPRLYWNVEKS